MTVFEGERGKERMCGCCPREGCFEGGTGRRLGRIACLLSPERK